MYNNFYIDLIIYLKKSHFARRFYIKPARKASSAVLHITTWNQCFVSDNFQLFASLKYVSILRPTLFSFLIRFNSTRILLVVPFPNRQERDAWLSCMINCMVLSAWQGLRRFHEEQLSFLHENEASEQFFSCYNSQFEKLNNNAHVDFVLFVHVALCMHVLISSGS